MKARRWVARLLLPLVLAVSLMAPVSSFAAVPALAIAADMIVPFVVRSVGRTAVLNVGTAANDAAFGSTFSTWAANSIRIGSLSVRLTDSLTAEIQAVSGEPLTQGQMAFGYSWYIENVPGSVTRSWVEQTGNRFKGVKATQAEAVQEARRVLGAWYGVTCFDGTGGQDNSVSSFDTSWDTAHAFCRPRGASTSIDHRIFVAHAAANAELADGVARVTRDSAGFGVDSTDPDWDYGLSMSQYLSRGTLRVSMPASDEENEMHIEFASSNQGVTVRAADTADGVNSSVKSMQTDSMVVPRVFEIYTTAALPDALPAISAPGGSTDSGTGTGTTVQFPSDYARQGEAGAAAQSLGDRLLATTDGPSDPTPAGEYSDWGTTFDGLKGWSIPQHSSECPTGSFTVWGQTFTLDSHCALMADQSSVLQAIMVVVWTLLALFIVLGA